MTMNQRWRDGSSSMRPTDPIDTTRYAVAEIKSDKIAKAFVEQHHYSGSYPAARVRFGMYRSAELVGVAVFSHPPSEATLARLPCERMAGIELGRFVLLDDVPGNGESWFLARCFEGLRRHDGWRDRRDWMWRAIASTCRRVEHAGNHRYLWALDRRLRKHVAKLATGAYPKIVDAAVA